VSLSDDAKEVQGEEDLRATNARLLRQLDKAKAKQEDMIAAVYRAAKDAASTLVVPPVPAPKKDKRAASPEIAICLLADWQAGKVTPGYNSDITAERVLRYADKVVKLIELQRSHHPVNEARIYLLGDLLEGEEIFPGQAHRIDASLYAQLFNTSNLLAQAVRQIASVVPKVRVVGAIGNHGSLGGPIRRSYHPESNFDAMLYNIARMQVGSDRVEWPETFVAGERAWYATDEVLGKRWFLFHGDQVKSASFGIPWYGFNKRLLGWATSVTPFDYSASGHWHVPVKMHVNAITHWGAGSTESANTFAQEFLASGGQRPSQWLLFQGADGVTSEYEVFVD
jgi:hypothetical protein